MLFISPSQYHTRKKKELKRLFGELRTGLLIFLFVSVSFENFLYSACFRMMLYAKQRATQSSVVVRNSRHGELKICYNFSFSFSGRNKKKLGAFTSGGGGVGSHKKIAGNNKMKIK